MLHGMEEILFNHGIGVTTPITKQSDLWERPYLHWNFVPKNFTKNEELTKRHKTETAPYNLHE